MASCHSSVKSERPHGVKRWKQKRGTWRDVSGSTMWPGWRNAVRLIRPSVSRTNSAEAEIEMRKQESAAGDRPGDLHGTQQVRWPRTKQNKENSPAEEKYSVRRTPTCFSQEGSERSPIGAIQQRLTQQAGRGGGVRERPRHGGQSGSRRKWSGRRSRAGVWLTQSTFRFRNPTGRLRSLLLTRAKKKLSWAQEQNRKHVYREAFKKLRCDVKFTTLNEFCTAKASSWSGRHHFFCDVTK